MVDVANCKQPIQFGLDQDLALYPPSISLPTLFLHQTKQDFLSENAKLSRFGAIFSLKTNFIFFMVFEVQIRTKGKNANILARDWSSTFVFFFKFFFKKILGYKLKKKYHLSTDYADNDHF